MVILLIFSGCIQQKGIKEDQIRNEKKGEVEETAETRYQEVPESSIGFIGCSNTRQTVQGYNFAGGKKLWPVDENKIHEYDGGAVLDWVRDIEKEDRFWRIFDEYLEENPNTKAVWWQLCIRKEEADMTYNQAFSVVQAIRERIQEVRIYVSALPEFPEHECQITGKEGIERANSLVKELDENNEDIVAGPVIGPLFLEDIDEGDESKCHPHVEGATKTGEQLKEFFDDGRMDKKNFERDKEEVKENNFEDINEELLPSFEEKIWNERIEAAMAPSECPEIPEQIYPSSYYTGPLIDTHLHIPAVPDWSPEEEMDEVPEGRFGGPQALLGWNVKMSEIACTLQREGTYKNFAFFPVYEGKISIHLLEIWNKTMEKYPEQFTPFIMSSGNDNEPDGFPTVDAKTLEDMLEVYPNLFQGYGEIGLYARENGGSPELPPDSERLKEIYPIIRKNNLVVYFHLGEGHNDNFERVLEQNPDINFIWHGDQLSVDQVEDILNNHPNAYYGVDAFWGHDRDLFLLFVGESKDEYIDKLNSNFDTVLNYAVSDWKEVIERHPDQFIWGIDRGDAVWNYDLDVGQLQIKLARAFIGKLNPEVQEKFAYKNAERLLEETKNE